MDTASFNGFLKTIFYIIAFYYIFRFLAKLFLPMLVKKAVEKAAQNFQQHQYGPYTNRPHQQSQENITVDTSKAARPRETNKVGEYVDYEELD